MGQVQSEVLVLLLTPSFVNWSQLNASKCTVQAMSSTAITVVKLLAGCTSSIMILSPSIRMYRVYKTKQIGLNAFVPLASLLANTHVWYVRSCDSLAYLVVI